jgi:hypothetical protein
MSNVRAQMAIHWWNTERLVKQLASNSLTQADAAKYMMVSAALYTQANYTAIWFGGYRSWALIAEFAMVLVIALIGVHECYKANGGAEGTDFLLRFCAIGIPVAVKLAVAGLIIGQGFYLAFPYVVTTSTFRDPSFIFQFFGFVYGLSVTFIYYWRVAFHLKALNA